MKIFHLSDLHIGKQLHHYSLLEDQKYILEQVAVLAEQLRPDVVLIAGDIYDKAVPSAEAVSLFDQFLTRMSAVRPKIPLMLIAGNHDSARRLDYASRLLEQQEVHISGSVPESGEEYLKKITLCDEYGEVNFYLLPFLRPGSVRGICGGELPSSYTEAVRIVLEREKVDFSKRNILAAHQFVTGAGTAPETCDSEMLSVGGIDNVDASVLERFDYVALGHLHQAQAAGREHIRYCGTLLKYSVSEADHRKALHMVELGRKGEAVRVKEFRLRPLRDLKRIRGTLSDILKSREKDRADDYVSIVLTDEIDPYRPKEQLEKVFPHILEIRMDNERTRKKLSFSDADIRMEDPLSAFGDFYREMQGRELSEEETHIVERIFDKVKGEVQ